MSNVGEKSGLLGKPCLYFGEESGTLREKLSCGLGGEQYSVAENAMFLGDTRVYLRRRRRAFGEKHRIRSQKDRMAWVEKDLKKKKDWQGHQPLDQAAQSHIQPGLECIQGWGIYNLPGLPVLHHPLCEKLPPNI